MVRSYFKVYLFLQRLKNNLYNLY